MTISNGEQPTLVWACETECGMNRCVFSILVRSRSLTGKDDITSHSSRRRLRWRG